MKLHYITREQLKDAVGDRDKTVAMIDGLTRDLAAAISCLSLTESANRAFMSLAVGHLPIFNQELRAIINKLEQEVKNGNH
jgi:hypothetical protein